MLLTVALGAMLVPLNSTMIAIALPSVVDDLDSDPISTERGSGVFPGLRWRHPIDP